MKTFTKFLMLSTIFASFAACEESDKKSDNLLDNTSWTYQAPRVEFEYNGDTLSFSTGDAEYKFTPAQLKGMLAGMAGEKMGAYFTGLDFGKQSALGNNLVISMVMDNAPETLGARYICDGKYVAVNLDSDDLERISGRRLNIPVISLNYLFDDSENTLTLYLDKSYIALMVGQMLPMLVGSIVDGYEMLPESVQTAILEGFRGQIISVLNNTKRLEVGAILKRVV